MQQHEHERIRRYVRASARLAEAMEALDNLILSTPTSEERNILTEVNILLMEAKSKLTIAQK